MIKVGIPYALVGRNQFFIEPQGIENAERQTVMVKLGKIDHSPAALYRAEIVFKTQDAAAGERRNALCAEGFFGAVVFAINMEIQRQPEAFRFADEMLSLPFPPQFVAAEEVEAAV